MSSRKVRALVVQSSGPENVVPSSIRSDAIDAGAVASALRAAGMEVVAECGSAEEAIEAATRQRAYVILFDVHDVPRRHPAEAPSSTEPLTNREQEILTVLAGGHSYADVACALGIAIDTVRSHVRSIYRKLDVCCKTEAVVVALTEGLLAQRRRVA